MQFEFDPSKSRSNKAKPGIDFEEARAFWDDDNAVVVEFALPEKGDSAVSRGSPDSVRRLGP
jgi:uncharacterized DUF497 family protein